MRLLLAEDNYINQKLAIALLQKAGYSVDAVETGAQALEKIKTQEYNAVLMDVQMPEMDGLEATRRIRAWESERGLHLPIIAMTAHAMRGDREQCLEAGMDDYVSKPLEPKTLFNALDRFLKTGEPAKESESPPDVFPADFDLGLFGESVPASRPTVEPASVQEAVSSSSALPLNLETALFRFGGDRDFMLEMCRDYKDHLPARLAEIQEAARTGDANRLTRAAHNLKGISLNFNAETLARLALQLEEAGRREDLTGVPALVEQLEIESQRALEYLANHVLVKE
ncbi:MAG: response regulator [Chloroflexota bacterium]